MKPIALLLATISASTLVLACGPSHRNDDDGLDPLRAMLDSPDGELGTSSESIVEADYDDIDPPVASDDTTPILPTGWARSISLLFVWGHRPSLGVDADTSRDWSGSIQVTGGRVRVAARVGFKDAGDAVLPRTSPELVEFSSHAAGTIDGLLLQVVQETPDASIRMDTELSDITVTLGSIRPDLSTTQPVGASDFLGFHAFATNSVCKDGVVFGRFRRLGAGIGRIHARVIDDHGLEIGRVRGIYGHSKAWDMNVLFGKYLQLDGTYGGRIRGTHAEGAFAGDWKWDRPLETGRFVGHYWEGPAGLKGRGLLYGHWVESCAAGGP